MNATGRKLAGAVVCFGTGTMVAVLKLEGATTWARDRLKMSVKTQKTSCSAHTLWLLMHVLLALPAPQKLNTNHLRQVET